MNKALLLSLSLIAFGLTAPVALASETGTHSCTAAVGLGADGVVGLAYEPTFNTPAGEVDPGLALGGCTIVDLTDTHTVTAVEPGTGCVVEADVDGDGFADEEVTVGATYDAGTSIVAFCYSGAVNAESSISLA